MQLQECISIFHSDDIYCFLDFCELLLQIFEKYPKRMIPYRRVFSQIYYRLIEIGRFQIVPMMQANF